MCEQSHRSAMPQEADAVMVAAITVAAMTTPAPIKDRNTPDTAFALPPSSLK